jgi:lysozyme family protein
MVATGSRRQVLLGAGVSFAGLVAPALVRAQPLGANPSGDMSLGTLLGGPVADPLRALLPQEAFQAVEFVSALIDLERQAKAARLPPSRLSTGEVPIEATLDHLYELAMPRLVALIDRAEGRSPLLAEKAGGLLAKLHQTQFVLPGWLAPLASPGAGNGRMGIDPGSDEAAATQVPQLELPQLELPQIELPQIEIPDVAEPEQPAQEDRPLPAIGRSFRFGDNADEYASWFEAAQIRPEHTDKAQWHLSMIRQSRPRYMALAKRTGVPWFFIASLHALEASFNFRAHLHNGDHPLAQRTRQVPAGRPVTWLPPSDWESSAIDALRLMGFAGATDWSLPRLLYRVEAYNGFGYRRMGKPTPYLWSFSTHYHRGKFVADGRYNPNARSQQCGAAVMLKVLEQAGDISFA